MKIRWLFEVAAPSLLGATSCAGAELVQGRMQITDGDLQEALKQEDLVLKSICKNSKPHHFCGWHMIELLIEKCTSQSMTQACRHTHRSQIPPAVYNDFWLACL